MISEPLSESGEDLSSVTVWSDIFRAQEPGASLNRVVERYTRRIQDYARRKWGRQPGVTVEDCTQSFLLKMLEGRVVRHADRTKGRFRRFILQAFNNHVIDILRKKSVAVMDDLDSMPAILVEPSELDRLCAEELLREAGYALAEICRRHNAPEIYVLVSDQLIDPILHGIPRLSQDALMAKYGYSSRNVISGKMRTARKWFREAVKRVISEYASAEELDEELSAFLALIPNAIRRGEPDENPLGCLHSYMQCDLERFDSMAWSRAPKTSAASDRTLRTYIELLSDEAPPLELLTLTKRFAKEAISPSHSGVAKSRLPRRAAKLLYYLSISVAREKHRVGSEFSALSDEALAQGLAACRYEMDDPQILALVRNH